MSTHNTGEVLTLSEIRKTLDPLGDMVSIISEFEDNVPELRYATFIPANRGTYHEIVRWDTRPSGSYTAYNEGITQEIAGTDMDVEPTAMLDGLSSVDARLIQNNGGMGQRLKRDKQYMNGMTVQVGLDLFNSDRGLNPRKPNGILKRAFYSDLSSPNVFDNAQGNASATANKTAGVVINFGEDLVNLVYPKNLPAPSFSGVDNKQGSTNSMFGIQVKDLGIRMKTDAAGKELPMWYTWLQFYWGLAIENRNAVHVLHNLTADPTVIDDVDDFGFNESVCYRMRQKVKKTKGGRGAVMFVSDEMEAAMWDRVNNKSNVITKGKDAFGNDVLMFIDIPIASTDSIPATLATAV